MIMYRSSLLCVAKLLDSGSSAMCMILALCFLDQGPQLASLTFRLPPVTVILTKRRVYCSRL